MSTMLTKCHLQAPKILLHNRLVLTVSDGRTQSQSGWHSLRRIECRDAVASKAYCCSKCGYAFEGLFSLKRHEKSCVLVHTLPPVPTSEDPSAIADVLAQASISGQDVEADGARFALYD